MTQDQDAGYIRRAPWRRKPKAEPPPPSTLMMPVPPAARDERPPVSTTAKYQFGCAWCRRTVEVGDTITSVARNALAPDLPVWFHDACATSAASKITSCLDDGFKIAAQGSQRCFGCRWLITQGSVMYPLLMPGRGVLEMHCQQCYLQVTAPRYRDNQSRRELRS